MNKTRFLNPKVNISLNSCLTIYLAIDLYLAVKIVSTFILYIFIHCSFFFFC